MQVTLPDSLRDWIETQASACGLAHPDQFVERVLRKEQGRTQREIDQKLIEGLESGEPIQVNGAFWAERRRVLEERLQAPAKESA